MSNDLTAPRPRRLHPLMVPRVMASAAASQVSMHFGIRGPAFAVSSACASSTHAVGLALQMLRSGAVDCAVAGGTEASLTFGALRAWEALRVEQEENAEYTMHNAQLGEGAGAEPGGMPIAMGGMPTPSSARACERAGRARALPLTEAQQRIVDGIAQTLGSFRAHHS